MNEQWAREFDLLVGDRFPRRVRNADGDYLVLCAGGCGTYIDELDVSPKCDRCDPMARTAWNTDPRAVAP